MLFYLFISVLSFDCIVIGTILLLKIMSHNRFLLLLKLIWVFRGQSTD